MENKLLKEIKEKYNKKSIELSKDDQEAGNDSWFIIEYLIDYCIDLEERVQILESDNFLNKPIG